MPQSRREFLTYGSVGFLAAAMRAGAQTPAQQSEPLPPGTPPAFGTAPAAGPEVSPATFVEAEKLAQVQMTPADLATAASNWRMQMAPLLERRTGPRKIEFEATLAPATLWNPSLPGIAARRLGADRFVRSMDAGLPLPASDEEIAFAPVRQLSRWIESRQTDLDAADGDLPGTSGTIQRATALRDHAVAGARPARRRGRRMRRLPPESIAGRCMAYPGARRICWIRRGLRQPMEPSRIRNRVPARDAAVVERLNAAGAVLVAKLSLGALALNDIWFGGQTMNPWLLEEGSSGSSAGPGSAVAAGLVGFAIGSETGGSIVSPSMRCGVTGLRPTFGRVPRTGAMTLCWSLDKLGPMARGVEDTMLVLKAISGPDAARCGAACPARLAFDAAAA